MKFDRERYDSLLPIHYASASEQAEVFCRDLDRFLRYFNICRLDEDCSFLDLGSANNDLSIPLSERRIPHVFFNDRRINFETDHIPLGDNAFDVILFKAVIEHLNDPTNILNNMMRMLKPGGIAVITTPNYDHNIRSFWNDPTHQHPYNPISLGKLLEIHEFEVLQLRPFFFRKPSIYWKLPFWLGAKIPFKNHTYPQWPIPSILRGNTTVLLAVAKKPLLANTT